MTSSKVIGMTTSSKSELRRSVFATTRAARCLVSVRKSDLLRAGTYKVTCQHLDRLEKQLYKSKRKSQSKDTIDGIAREVAQLIGNITKSLIRYLLSPCCNQLHYQGCRYTKKGVVVEHDEHWINIEASESCFGPKTVFFGERPRNHSKLPFLSRKW